MSNKWSNTLLLFIATVALGVAYSDLVFFNIDMSIVKSGYPCKGVTNQKWKTIFRGVDETTGSNAP